MTFDLVSPALRYFVGLVRNKMSSDTTEVITALFIYLLFLINEIYSCITRKTKVNQVQDIIILNYNLHLLFLKQNYNLHLLFLKQSRNKVSTKHFTLSTIFGTNGSIINKCLKC